MQREGNLNNFVCLAEQNKTEGNKISILFGYWGGGLFLWGLRFREIHIVLGVCAKGNKTNMPIGYGGHRSEGEGKPISNSHVSCLGSRTHQHVLQLNSVHTLIFIIWEW